MFSILKRKQEPYYRSTSLPTLSRYLTPFAIPLAMQLLAHNLRPHPGSSLLLASHYAHQDRRMATHFFLTGPMFGKNTNRRIGWRAYGGILAFGR